MNDFIDGEVMGIDKDGFLILWDGENEKPYNCGESLDDFGIKNLTSEEKQRLSLTKKY